MKNQEGIRTRWYGNALGYQFISELTDWSKTTAGTRNAFTHLLILSESKMSMNPDGGFYAYVAEFMSTEWLRAYNVDVSFLLRVGLLKTDGKYYHLPDGKGKCLYYWIPLKIIKAFMALPKNRNSKLDVNLFDGQRPKDTKRPRPSVLKQISLYDKNRNLMVSKDTAESIAILSERVPVNIAALEEEIDELITKYKKAEREGFISDESGYIFNDSMTEEENKAKAAEIKRDFDKQTRYSFLVSYYSQELRIGDFGYYTPRYSCSYTGRINELGSAAFQRLSDDVRRLLMRDIQHVNFDIQSSQLNGLYFYNRDPEILALIDTFYPEAEKLGFDKKMMKQVIFGAIFNFGETTDSYKWAATYAKDNGLDFAPIDKMLAPVCNASRAAAEMFEKEPVWINLNGDVFTRDDMDEKLEEKWLEYYNAKDTTVRYWPLAKQEAHKAKFNQTTKARTLLAFYLQGLEAHIISCLTRQSIKRGYRIFFNLYDGVIATGRTDNVQIVMNEINQRLGYEFKLVEKPL